LTYEEVERHLNFIFSQVKFTEISIGGEDVFLKYTLPSSFLKSKSDFIYNKAFKEGIDSGLLSTASLEEVLKKHKIISDEEQKRLTHLKSQLEAQKVLLSKTKKVEANKEKIINYITSITNDIYTIESKITSKMGLSAESKAEEERLYFLCSQCTYDFNDNLFWPSYEKFLLEKNITKRDKILLEFIRFYRGLSIHLIRHIARSNLWRVRYINASKLSESLFGVPTSEYTNDMLNLVYWSNYYQNIYDMMPDERPDDFVIEDDEELDKYMEEYYKRKEKEFKAQRMNNKLGKLSAFNKEEVIVTRSNELYQEINYDTPKEAKKLKGKDINSIRKKASRRSR